MVILIGKEEANRTFEATVRFPGTISEKRDGSSTPVSLGTLLERQHPQAPTDHRSDLSGAGGIPAAPGAHTVSGALQSSESSSAVKRCIWEECLFIRLPHRQFDYEN